MTLTIKEDAQTEAAKLDGCYVLKTDLTPAQAPKELVHDRYNIWPLSSTPFGPAKPPTSKCAPSSYA